jgi:hypothetical protein
MKKRNLSFGGSGRRSWGSSAVGISTFLGLTDTPDSYAGKANQNVVVNSNETGLIFSPGGIKCFIGDYTYMNFEDLDMNYPQFMFALPAGAMIIATRLKCSEKFEGTGITDYYLSLGDFLDKEKLMAQYDAKNIVVASNEYAESLTFQSLDYENPINIFIHAESFGANLDLAFSGACKVEVFYIERFF